MKSKKSLYNLLALLVLASMVLAACGNQPTQAPAPTATEAPAITWPDWATRSCNTDNKFVFINTKQVDCAEVLGGEAPNNVPEPISVATEPPAAEATAEAPELSCLETLNKQVNRPYQWLENLDVGDAKFTSILFTKNGSGDSLVAIIDPVFNYDVEAPTMTGVYYQTADVSMDDIACAARLLAEQNEVTNLVYIGLGDAPEDFTKDYEVDGFTTSIWIYTEMPIETGSAHWATFTAAKTDKNHVYGDADAYAHGQFWNGINSKTVYHWITEPGWQLTTPKLQGTYWEVTGWSDVWSLVLERFVQMTGEVEQRDGHPTVVKTYCGDDEPPTGYSVPTQPSDWVCERMP